MMDVSADFLFALKKKKKKILCKNTTFKDCYSDNKKAF